MWAWKKPALILYHFKKMLADGTPLLRGSPIPLFFSTVLTSLANLSVFYPKPSAQETLISYSNNVCLPYSTGTKALLPGCVFM